LCFKLVSFISLIFQFNVLRMDHDLVHRVENVYARLCTALVSILRHQNVEESAHHELWLAENLQIIYESIVR
jgi:hypothetical protein